MTVKFSVNCDMFEIAPGNYRGVIRLKKGGYQASYRTFNFDIDKEKVPKRVYFTLEQEWNNPEWNNRDIPERSGQIIHEGQGFLGLFPQSLTSSMAELLGLKDTKGVIISEIVKDSPADKAGLKHNDVILELNGKPVESEIEFRRNVAILKPGTNVEIVVWRNGQKVTLNAKIDKWPTDE